MTNHIHLLMQVSDVALGRVILCIASRYARTVQERFSTTGHLFERRHYAVPVDADIYLLTLLRYIHLNLVRAGLAADPSGYRWSSHGAYLDRRRHAWITTEFALRMLAADADTARARYCKLIGDREPCRWGSGALTPHREHPHILGDDDFVSRVVGISWKPRLRKSIDELLVECTQRFGVSTESIMSPSRARHLSAARAWLSHEAVTGRVATISAMARYFGRSETAIRRLMARHPPRVGDQ
ncbi:MAG: transposase [Steroidobacteraceae bacterium]